MVPKKPAILRPRPPKKCQPPKQIKQPHLFFHHFSSPTKIPPKTSAPLQGICPCIGPGGVEIRNVRFLQLPNQLDSKKIEEIQVSIKCMVNWWLTSLQSTSNSAFSMVFTSQPPFLICPLLRCCVFCMFIFRKQKNKRRHMQHFFAVVHGLCRLEGLLIAGFFFTPQVTHLISSYEQIGDSISEMQISKQKRWDHQ